MDLLSDVLSSLRLRGDLYFLTDFSGDWAVALPPEGQAIRVHLVVRGQCWVDVEGTEKGALLHEGDFALVPHGAAQTLSSEPDLDLEPASLPELMGDGNPDDDGILRYEGRGCSEGRRSRIVCGLCRFDERLSHPMFLGLPPLIVLRARATGDSPWLAEAVRVTILEANLTDVGMREILGRLIEILFIQSIRQKLRATDDPNPFLVAVSDNHLRPALRAMHDELDTDWTVQRLARLSGMSRTQFARRFREALHRTPMQYLTDWRLQKARQWLRETDASVEEIGRRSGYRSQPSFTRRFKERFGVTPLAYRRGSDGRR